MATDLALGTVSNVFTMTSQPLPADLKDDISGTLVGRDRTLALLSNLVVQRKLAYDAFLQGYAVDLAKVTGVPDKAFVDAEYTKFTAWQAADLEAGKRIDALALIEKGLEQRVTAFERLHRDDVIEVLKLRIQTLQAQHKVEELDERALAIRLEQLRRELHRLERRGEDATGGAAAAKSPVKRRRAAKSAARKAAKGRGARKGH